MGERVSCEIGVVDESDVAEGTTQEHGLYVVDFVVDVGDRLAYVASW